MGQGRLRARFAAMAAGVVAAAMGGPIGAQQTGPTSADPEANIVEALVVTARRPAPAWWRVRDEATGSTVWILGVLDTPIPPDVAWRRQELDERLKGAKALITGAQLHAGLEDIFGFFKLWSMIRTDDMEAGLDPALRARFVADRAALSQGPERYAHWRPMIAGSVLLREARPAGSHDVGRQVRAEAGKAGVPAKPAGIYDFMPFARMALSSMTPVTEGACLSAALDDVEAGAGVVRRAAEGWARGDVATALTAPRRFDRCLLLMAGGPELWARSNDDLAGAIAEQLKTPGKAVAVAPLRRLLAKDGLIDALKARGLRVIGPDEDADDVGGGG